MRLTYTIPKLRALTSEQNQGQHPCWNGSAAFGGQCGSGGTAGTSCVSGYTPFAS